ncbi:MAG: cupin domain-containing protein [Candidatus Hodarchaeales archaeon]|jgi:quercetin dioxygenase-like cupin family protein
MKIINEKEIEPVSAKGSQGEVYLRNIVNTNKIVIGLRTIAPESDIPTRPHKHEDPHVVYVIKGLAKLSNGQETREVKTGDCIMIESWEEHYFTSGKDEVLLLGVKWK